MIGISCKTTNRFNSLERKLQQANFKNLGHAAATLRTIVRNSIKTRKKTSKPGQPPSGPTRQLKNSILYDVDRPRQRAIIGPIKLSGKTGRAPATLERGGKIKTKTRTVKVKNKPGRNARGQFVSAGVRETVIEGATFYIRARPYMGPALTKIQPRLSRMWASSIK